MSLSLRKSIQSDLKTFFVNQSDPVAIQMAAFTPEDPHNEEAYITKWARLLDDDTINMQTILRDQKVLGCVVKYVMHGEAEITYAISKELWGQGITTKALKLFLEEEKTRPIFGRVAFDNIGSQKVLERAGFMKIGEEKNFANARDVEIIEFIYKLY